MANGFEEGRGVWLQSPIMVSCLNWIDTTFFGVSWRKADEYPTV
jgi:hypothetical protein